MSLNVDLDDHTSRTTAQTMGLLCPIPSRRPIDAAIFEHFGNSSAIADRNGLFVDYRCRSGGYVSEHPEVPLTTQCF
jgi:hypothetical protein